MPFPKLPAAARHFSAFDHTELTWSGPINDFPLVEMNTPKAKPNPRGEPEKPLPPEGADAFHPRQRIFTDSAHPTHPRQTLINSAAPLEPPKILPTLPNIVQFQEMVGPVRPRLQISQETLSKLRPREHRAAKVTEAPLPDVPAFEQKPAEITLADSPNAPARPKLELNTGVARASRHVRKRVTPNLPRKSALPSPVLRMEMPQRSLPSPPRRPSCARRAAAARESGRARFHFTEGKQPGVPGARRTERRRKRRCGRRTREQRGTATGNAVQRMA